jgi:hypothetical protein
MMMMMVMMMMMTAMMVTPSARAVEVSESTVEFANLYFNDENTPWDEWFAERLLASFSVRPGESALAKAEEFAGHILAMGGVIDALKFAEQAAQEQVGHLLALPWSKTADDGDHDASCSDRTGAGFPVAPVPWAFHRLRTPGDPSALSDLVGHVRLSIVNARSHLSRLLATGSYGGYGSRGDGSGVLDLEGMSDASVRHLINNLASAPGTRYLEVGSWRGSTLASALGGGNDATVDLSVAIDLWDNSPLAHGHAEDNAWVGQVLGDADRNFEAARRAVEEVALAHRHRHRHRQGDDAPAEKPFINDRCFLLRGDFRALVASGKKRMIPRHQDGGGFNVYLFDGPHKEQDHYDGIAMYIQYLAPTFVLLIDDWNIEGVQRGTFRAIRDFRLRVVFSEVLGGGRHSINMPGSKWHNGFFVAVIQQQQERAG